MEKTENKKEATKETPKKAAEKATEKKETVKKETEKKETPVKEDLEKKCSELKDQMLRHQAELENYKKRLVREKEEAVLFANSKLIEDLLEFMDNLERAISAAKAGGDIKALTDGITLIQSQLISTLGKNWGLEPIDCVGKDFNPEEHEACMAVVDESLKTETVLEEFQKGYKLHDRVIRPAKVKIGKPE